MRLSALALFRIHQRSSWQEKEWSGWSNKPVRPSAIRFTAIFNDRLMKGFQKYGYDVILCGCSKYEGRLRQRNLNALWKSGCIRCRRKLCPAEKMLRKLFR